MPQSTCSDPTTIPGALSECVRTSERTCVLTGAGISAESGVPTFRDAQTGLWARFSPHELASPEAFAHDPETVWDWYQWRRELIANARPNAGHQALARLQDRLPRLDLVTQNVDGFHTLAGSDPVLKLHGNIQRNICSRTRCPIGAVWIEEHADSRPPPSPHHADGLARPDVVWFGESLDVDTLEAAFAAAEACDLMMVVGTSGAVQPAASLPVVAARAGATVIEINPEASELSHLADWRLAGLAAQWLPALLASLDA